MITWIRRKLLLRLASLREVEQALRSAPAAVQFLSYIVHSFTRAWISAVIFVFSIPVHLAWSPQSGFLRLARRKDDGEFLESYAVYLRQQRLSVLSAMALLVVLGIELSVVSFGLYKAVEPKVISAFTSSVTLNPTWDRTAEVDLDFNGACDQVGSEYYACESATATTLKIDYLTGACPGTDRTYRMGMKFDLSSIPNNATITDVDLTVNVSDTTTATVAYFPVTTDTPDTVSCTTAGSSLYEKLNEGSAYATASDWNTTGAKTIDLGTTADSNVQSRLTGSDLIAIGVRSPSSAANVGAVSSVDASSNKPQLVISYTTPPEAPTNAGHSANTTAGITWTWTDNATADTSNRVHDASHAAVCTTGAASGTGTTVSCTEGSLSANTQYTRHPNVLDADGNTDGPSASAYTSIETPTGLSFSGTTATGITAAATGTMSNLTNGSSGVYFQESVTSTNSGWTQTNSWAKSGLTANTQYSFQVKARNGDGDDTSLTSASTKYTLSATPNATSSRSTSTWYTSGAFPFTNAAGWGSGGVQYYRYAWGQDSSHTFTGSESTWSNLDANCPGGSCTDAGTTLSKTATANGSNWYLHVQGFNGDGVANGTASNGPYFFNSAAPTISDNQAGDTTPRKSSGTTYDVDFAKAADGSQIDYAQYSVYSGQNKSGALLKDWTSIFTDDTASFTTDWSLDFEGLPEGTSYVSVRAVALDGLSSEADDVFVVVRDTVAPTAPVSYSKTSATTDPVIATLKPSEPVTVTNNEGLTSYRFMRNGTFTFTFQDEAGNEGSATATVSNIVVPKVSLIRGVGETVRFRFGRTVKAVKPFARGYSGGGVALKVDYGQTLGTVYVFVPSGGHPGGVMTVFNSRGRLLQKIRPRGVYFRDGLSVSAVREPLNNTVFIATGPKDHGRVANLYRVTPSRVVSLPTVDASGRSRSGNVRVKFLKLYAQQFGLVTMVKDDQKTLRVWKYSLTKEVFLRDTEFDTKKIKVQNGEISL